MLIPISEKFKLIRESERLNKRQVSELTGIPYTSLCSYETGDKNPGVEAIMKFFHCYRFTKYTLWFIADQTSPSAGQIAPLLAQIFDQDASIPKQNIW